MKIRMIRPLPRIDHVIPAGFVLDAPEGFARKMVRTGRAVFVLAPGEVPALDDLDEYVPEAGKESIEDAETAEATPETEVHPETEASDAAEEDEAPKPVKKPTRARKGS